MGRDSEEQALVFEALSDPTRRQIVEDLSRVPEASISDIAGRFPISRQAVTKHLGILEDAGLIDIEKRGREKIVTLRPAALLQATSWLDEVGRRWDTRLAALEKHLTESS